MEYMAYCYITYFRVKITVENTKSLFVFYIFRCKVRIYTTTFSVNLLHTLNIATNFTQLYSIEDSIQNQRNVCFLKIVCWKSCLITALNSNLYLDYFQNHD